MAQEKGLNRKKQGCVVGSLFKNLMTFIGGGRNINPRAYSFIKFKKYCMRGEDFFKSEDNLQ